jgi:DNA polymerase elongation subunit (family B)
MYQDFEDEKNIIWFFDENNQYKQYHLKFMIAGDTDSAYSRLPKGLTKDLTNEEIVIVADEVGNLVNKTFPAHMKRLFNCPDERLGVMQTDREAVSDKSFFLSKKRYIMHVIDMEGEPCDKMKIMGVEIKKSNTSTITKRFLTELVDLILDGNSRDDVLQRVKEMEQEFKSADIKDVATTMNAKKIKSATETYELTGKLTGHYASKAALVYNIMASDQDKKIVPGDKICLVYIKDAMGAIGFPAEANTLPEWLLEIPLDYDKMWEKCKQTITNYLKALGWDIESQKEALAEELFGLTKVKKKGKKK